MRILLSGMVAGVPHQGGATWAVLQYLLGLRALGHDVLLVEPADVVTPPAQRYFREVVARFGLQGCASLMTRGTGHAMGVPYRDAVAFADRADVLIDIAGMLDDPELRDRPAVRTYLDLDPAFTQLWHAVEGIDMRFEGHDRFLTVGTRIGAQDCPVPTGDLDWLTTLPPVVLDHWAVDAEAPVLPFTTVANWRGYGSVTFDGIHYGQKAHSLRPLVDLPQRVDGPFALALSIHPDEVDDLAALGQHGWQLLNPAVEAATPDAYRQFVRRSTAELGIAKSGYVASRSGWFSDRSACYLAAGRPVIAQDTGFGSALPTGEGLFAFTDVDDVATAVNAVCRDYPKQRRAARAIAEAHLDSRRVLPQLLQAVMG